MFNQLNALPADPLLGIIERFAKDSNPQKIDLGVGIYKNEEGHTPVLVSVKTAEANLLQQQDSKAYIGPRGDALFTQLMCELALGEDHRVLQEGRVAALQTPGGCGALRIAAELLVRAKSNGARIWVSDPTWANHVPLLGSSGLEIIEYPYYDYDDKSIRFDDMLSALSNAKVGDFVLLHACCHNPCGADLSQAQWLQVASLLLEKQLVPFVDMAYQGFGESLEADAFGLRTLADTLPETVFAISCSKNFGLYRERVGVVGFIADSSAQAQPIASHLMQIVRGIYSMPPDHGAAVVRLILSDETLRGQWQDELQSMRERIQSMRRAVVARMGADFSFIERESGMFSFLGISPEQVQRLAKEHAIYMVDSSRFNVAGLAERNIDYFCDALKAVL